MSERLSRMDLLRQIRSAIEYEITLSGETVVLDSMQAVRSAKAPSAVPTQSPADANQELITPEALHPSSTPRPQPPTAQKPEASVADTEMQETGSSGNDPLKNQAGSASGSGEGDGFFDAPPGTVSGRFEALIPDSSPLRSLVTLAEVEAWVASTHLIPIDEARTNPVFGVGNPNADLMVIGEAPGADEDRQGEPFVGRAGQLLNQILAAIGFDRSEVYIANILKSRPPNNRDPLPAEVEAHIPVLYKQIALIAPRIILCVGKTAGNSLLGHSGSLKALRGKFHDYHGVPVLVTYHPAALLRNPQWKRPTWEDVQKLRAMYDKLTGAVTGA